MKIALFSFHSNAVLVHCLNSTSCLIMVALWNRADHYIFAL